MAECGGLDDFRVGELVQVRCPMVPARVAEVTNFHVFVEWPWGRVDPASKFAWNGQRAFSRNASSIDWIASLFRTDPEPWHLSPGQECHVGIPERVMQVIDVYHCDPPRDIGRLPRPHTMLAVIPADHPEYADLEDACDTIEVPSAAPLTLTRV
ncbi:hypothetical protein [Saccharomonospora xinjiangensis]|uniref:Uncharacterized protein n=1 Tax=Saccharomonospora xinjiangensis XJ-54 TaxID=882086 RepID=I0V4I4_9PSEU|nr:hypothetical protein [Saccharomonospora xinjiangensis]EID55037.1 hypothetical protein SacxiDRAFT_2819 [Saccharomonospora xinjiangensis XJ-54]